MKDGLKVLLLIGLPASGKSTWATDYIKKNPDWMRVSRDHFRFMLREQGQLDFREEGAITDLVYATARKALMLGYNVIVDSTHLSTGHVQEIIDALKDLASIDYRYFDTPYKTCLERNAIRPRDRQLSEQVMEEYRKAHDEFVECFHWKPVRRTGRIVPDYTAGFDQKLPYAILVDMDGTLAHRNNRRDIHDLKKVDLDDPDWPVIEIVRTWKESLPKLVRPGRQVIVVTGREETCREETEEWLKAAGVPYDRMLMRPDNDWRRDASIKLELYENHIRGKYNVVCVFDDRD